MAAGKKYPEQVYIEEEKNEKYMEGNYDGDADQQYKQERADKRRSIQMEEDIRASQEAVYEKETERLSYEQKAVGEAFTKIMKEYVEDNIYQQYLVDGAVLRCNQAMTDDVVFTEWGEKVVLENKADEVCNIILNVPENPVYEDDDSENSMMINGLRYATVKDTIKNINIIVPKCNCRLAADRDEEEKRIRNDTDRNKNGVCMHLMRLNEEWDNFEVKDKEGFRIKYAKRVNVAPSPFSAGAGWMLDGSEDVVEEAVEGITMTSVLFCKHGGLIMPVTSGQESLIMSLDIGINKMAQYLQGGVSEQELMTIIAWIADNCGLSVNDMIQGQFSEEVDSDSYERSIRFDDQIIAWTYYWNIKIQNEFTSKFEIDPNIVKAIIAQESSFGSDEMNKAKNPTRNVMQSLATGNSIVWVASGINPYDNGMFSIGDSISYILLDGTVGKDGSLAKDNLPYFAEQLKKDNTRNLLEEEREKQHFGDFDILKRIFEIGNDGKYIVNFDNVTSNMSIATGIGVLANSIQKEGSVYHGVQEYNTLENYVEHINRHLVDLGYEKIKPN